MEIVVNGEKRSVEDGTTVKALIESLGLKPGATAVQRNDDILKREEFQKTKLKEGDVLELVRFVGGG